MTQEEETNLQRLQTRVRQLILAYQELEAQCSKLKDDLDASRASEQLLHQEIETLRQSYDTLKTARLLSVSGTDAQEAKTRISRLIREVDKCLALLNI